MGMDVVWRVIFRHDLANNQGELDSLEAGKPRIFDEPLPLLNV
jgi:hypothetical protein